MTLYAGQALKHFWHVDLEEQLSFEGLLAEISARFLSLPADQIDGGIDDALRVVCSSLGVDESTIYLREIDHPDIFVLSYVLRDPALPPPPKIKFTAADNFPWCNRKLIANEMICLTDTQAAPPEAAIDKASWKKYNVVSALVIPLSTGGGRPLGFWGIDSTTEKREWSETLQKRLAIIAGVFANTLERAASHRQLRESEERLRLAADTAGAGFWTIDTETSAIWATPKLEELFGVKPEDVFDEAKFLGIVHPEDRDRVKQVISAMSRGEEKKVEYRIAPSPGKIRWVMSQGGRYLSAENRSLLMGITIDISESRARDEALRTVSGRLIDAQEQERKRIARELHDSIGQQVAIFAVGLGQLKSTVDPRRTKNRKAIEKLVKDTNKLASDIKTLSHELHSSSLEFLGLVPAIRGLCREVSERHQVEINFTESNVPGRVPPDVALALFRITQESLHNALKYSGERAFTVQLQGSGTHLELAISDNGAGFDVNEARASRGLGLISMRERILALKGTISIESQPMHGTRVRARVPISNGDDVGRG
jgi:PAS domain S-box-containing protein